MKSELERILETQLIQVGLRDYLIAEYRFHYPRRWRFDFANSRIKVAIECEGGTWSGGRHTRGSGFEKDCHKYNQAAIDGWLVLRYTRNMIESGEAIKQIESVLSGSRNRPDKNLCRTCGVRIERNQAKCRVCGTNHE